MYEKILVATDGSEMAQKAVEHGVRLAKSVGAKIVFVTVTESWSALVIATDAEFGKIDTVNKFEASANGAAAKILDATKDYSAKLGMECETRHVRDRLPAEGIIEAAELEDCDLVIMASHGRRGLGKMMLGSQTAEVLAFSKKPVLVLR
jgi:nucleotide-binding universal stress UspA family protein